MIATCPCGFACSLPPDSSAWHRAHRATHVIVFPLSTLETRMALGRLVHMYELRERERTIEDVAQRTSVERDGEALTARDRQRIEVIA